MTFVIIKKGYEQNVMMKQTKQKTKYYERST